MTSPLNLPAPGRCQAVYFIFQFRTALCFCFIVAWTYSLRPTVAGRDPFSRSYGVNLPSSLTVNHSSALVYSTRPPVSVYGTGTHYLELRRFSRELDYRHYQIARGRSVLSGLGSVGGFACLPRHLTPLTCISVSTRACHFSVSPSQ